MNIANLAGRAVGRLRHPRPGSVRALLRPGALDHRGRADPEPARAADHHRRLAARRCGPCRARSARAGCALGATRWQTVRAQVLPAALPGILTGTILALSRAIGEAAPMILVGAAAFIAVGPERPELVVHGAADPDLQLDGASRRTGVPRDRRCRHHRPASPCCSSSTSRRSSFATSSLESGDWRERQSRSPSTARPSRPPMPAVTEARPRRRARRCSRARTCRSTTPASAPSAASTLRRREEPDHGADRPVRLRQDDVHPLPEPHERPHPGRRGRGRDPLPRRRTCTTKGIDAGRRAAPHRHGLPEAEPVPEVDLRQHRLRPRVNGIKGNMDELVEHALRRPRSGTRSRTSSRATAWRSRAASSSVSASPARSRSSPR